MARWHAARPGIHLLIAAAALLLFTDAAAAGAAVSADMVPDVPLGAIRYVPTGEDGLVQFEIIGTTGAGLLHLGLRPFPGSVLLTEDDQAIDPTSLNVEDDMLSMTFKVEGAGRLWVVTGTPAVRSLQVLAVLEPDEGDRAEGDQAAATRSDAVPPGFPSDAVLDELRRISGNRSPSWFSRTRLGPWVVPRRDSDLPPLPGCDPPLTAAGLRTCARQSLAAIWDCFATRGMATRAIPKALAIYLDDRVAYRAARAASAGADCRQVLTLEPDRVSQERARQIVAASFVKEGDAGRAAAPAAHGAVAAPADVMMRTRREAEIADLMTVLDGSCAGKDLIQRLRDSGGTGLDASVSLLVHEVARSVESWTGQVPDESDGTIVDAARALEDLPRGAGCDPVVAVMALIDEWSARVAQGPSTNGAQERFIAAFRDAQNDQSDDLKLWLPDRFPLLHRDALRILKYLG
jgi:hypothetical protein